MFLQVKRFIINYVFVFLKNKEKVIFYIKENIDNNNVSFIYDEKKYE